MLHIPIKEYDYNLPEDKIALYPCKERDKSKLLIWNKGDISESVFSNIGDFLPQNALLIFNDTRVLPARLVFYKDRGARIEIFCLEPYEPKEITTAYSSKGSVTFACMIGNRKKWKSGNLTMRLQHCTMQSPGIELQAEIAGDTLDCFLVKFAWRNSDGSNSNLTFSEVLELAGKIPLPPYINRNTEKEDKERYQTIYARYNGSVAAPTAGLHFTQEMLQKISQEKAYLTLHVGAGTFKPVKTDNISEHLMHAEKFSVSTSFLKQLKKAILEKRPIIPVGTTSMRTLESLYYLAVCETNEITQWQPYTTDPTLKSIEAIDKLLANIKTGSTRESLKSHASRVKQSYLMDNEHLRDEAQRKDLRNLEVLSASTALMIAPSYKFKFASGIITNFHQPKSTLLLLISAMLGNDWKTVYNYALQNDFRFLSYGDSNLYLL